MQILAPVLLVLAEAARSVSSSSVSSPAVGASPAGRSSKFPARIDLPNGFFPEGIERGRGTTFFVGSLLDGTVLRGDLRTGSAAVLTAGAPGSAAAGIAYEARHDRIWVAGGGPQLVGNGDVRVYDASSGAQLATYQPPGVKLLNDVAVTRNAVYVTDSAFPQLVVIPWHGMARSRRPRPRQSCRSAGTCSRPRAST